MFGRKRGRGFAAAQGGPAPQRARAGAGGVGRAIAASMYYRRKYPGWGRVYIPPNSELDAVGATWATATPAQRATRQRMHMHGHGAYNYGRAALRFGARYAPQIGRAMGAATGLAGASDLGGHAGAFVRKQILGSGAYNTNSLVNHQKSDMGVASFSSSDDETGALHICHEEYIQDILGTTPFVNNAFPINPGDPALFPWLSQIAANYDEYEFSGLVFTYKTVSSDSTVVAGASSNLGTVIMACNYNAAASPFSTKQQMMEYDGAARVKISEDLVFGIECDKSKVALSNHLFIAPNGSVPAGEDVKTYYHGLFQIATNQAAAAAAQIGELWVSYRVTLRKPKLGAGSGNPLPSSTLRLSGTSGSNILTATAFYNNLEDLNYRASAVPTSLQISNGFVTADSRVLGVAQPDDYYGWNVSYINTPALVPGVQGANGIVMFTYNFPPWLQQGQYDISLQANNLLSIDRVGFSGYGDVACDVGFASSPGVAIVSRGFSNLANVTGGAHIGAGQVDLTVVVTSSQQGTGVVQFVSVAFEYAIAPISGSSGTMALIPTVQTALVSLQLSNPGRTVSGVTSSVGTNLSAPRVGTHLSIVQSTGVVTLVAGQTNLRPVFTFNATTGRYVVSNLYLGKAYQITFTVNCTTTTSVLATSSGGTVTFDKHANSGTYVVHTLIFFPTATANSCTVTITGTGVNPASVSDYLIQECQYGA